jgi:hypothetical protein
MPPPTQQLSDASDILAKLAGQVLERAEAARSRTKAEVKQSANIAFDQGLGPDRGPDDRSGPASRIG